MREYALSVVALQLTHTLSLSTRLPRPESIESIDAGAAGIAAGMPLPEWA